MFFTILLYHKNGYLKHTDKTSISIRADIELHDLFFYSNVNLRELPPTLTIVHHSSQGYIIRYLVKGHINLIYRKHSSICNLVCRFI